MMLRVLFHEFSEDPQHAHAENGVGDDPEAIAEWFGIDKRR
jgi:hypothetical protein